MASREQCPAPQTSFSLSFIDECQVAAPPGYLLLPLLFVPLSAPTDFRYPVRHHLQTVGSRSQASPQSAMRRTSALLEDTYSSLWHIVMCPIHHVPQIGSVHGRSIHVTRSRRRFQSILVLFFVGRLLVFVQNLALHIVVVPVQPTDSN